MFSLKHQGTSAGPSSASGTAVNTAEENIAIDDDGDNDVDEDEESPFRDPPEGCVRLRPSQFNGVPSTVFVEYPPELKIRRNDVSIVEPLGIRKLGYKTYWERICIKNVHCRAGFQKSEKYWTSLWSKHQNAEQMKELNCLQKVNHFPASWCIGRKDRLTRTLNSMKRALGANGALFDFHPETFILPGERESLHRLVKTEISTAISAHSSGSGKFTKNFNSTSSTSMAGGMWIVKPVASSCGQGITVVTGQQALVLAKKKKAVVQRYLARPYLIDGRKFDLRIYVLVSGVDPLRVYIHDEGLTRISTAKYTLKNLANSYAHLTNYSINKNAPNFKAAEFNSTGGGSTDEQQQDGDGAAASGEWKDPEMEGFKWSLAAFRRWLCKKEGREVMEQTFDRIFDLCLKTVIAAEGEITPHLHSAAQYRTNCFELFGCDVILDSHLRPHLLEVNVSPSLMGSSPLDKKIKGMVIADTLHIVGMYPHDPALLKKYDTNSGAGTSSGTGAGAALRRASSFRSSGSEGGPGPAEPPGNPFSFTSLSKLMSAQDRYRRDPCPESIDIAALGDTDASWLLLLMAEDELTRAKSSKFHCVHPTPNNASYYSGLYRSCRFSDHLLAHWVMHGGSRGRYAKLIPTKYRKTALTPLSSPSKPTGHSPALSFNAVPMRPESSSGGRMRAKSAGRAPSATQRTSTYIPSAMESTTSERVSSIKAPAPAVDQQSILTPRTARNAVANYGSSEHMPEQHLSRREAASAGAKSQHHKASRGSSEPRSRVSADLCAPQDRELDHSGSKVAFGSPTPAGARGGSHTPSSVRSRLESGLSRAAYYASSGIACDTSEFDDAVGRESVDVDSPGGGRRSVNQFSSLGDGLPSPKAGIDPEAASLRPASRSRTAGTTSRQAHMTTVTLGGAARFQHEPSPVVAPRPSSSQSAGRTGPTPDNNKLSRAMVASGCSPQAGLHPGFSSSNNLLQPDTSSRTTSTNSTSNSAAQYDARVSRAASGSASPVPRRQGSFGVTTQNNVIAPISKDSDRSGALARGGAGSHDSLEDLVAQRGRNSPVLGALPITQRPEHIDATSNASAGSSGNNQAGSTVPAAGPPRKHRQLSVSRGPDGDKQLMAQIQQTLLAVSLSNAGAAELKLARAGALEAFQTHSSSNLHLEKAAPPSPPAAVASGSSPTAVSRPAKESLRV